MPKLPDGLTNVSLSSDSEHDHTLHDVSLQVSGGASAGDSKGDTTGDAVGAHATHDPNQPPAAATFTNISINSSSTGATGDNENGGCCSSAGGVPGAGSVQGGLGGLIGDASTMPVDEEEEANRLIDQILDLQKTLDDLTSRMDSVKEDNLVLKSENQVLSQYIENVMHASSSFQQMSPKSRKRALAKFGQFKNLSQLFAGIGLDPTKSRNGKR